MRLALVKPQDTLILRQFVPVPCVVAPHAVVLVAERGFGVAVAAADFAAVGAAALALVGAGTDLAVAAAVAAVVDNDSALAGVGTVVVAQTIIKSALKPSSVAETMSLEVMPDGHRLG